LCKLSVPLVPPDGIASFKPAGQNVDIAVAVQVAQSESLGFRMGDARAAVGKVTLAIV